MKETNTLVIGSSIAGLATAGCLAQRGIDYTIIEKTSQIAMPWRRHYERLHLHTNKTLSGLPGMPFGKKIPRYPTRQQVVDYMDAYAAKFDIRPIFNCEATEVKRVGDHWRVSAGGEVYSARHVVVATGPFGRPRRVDFEGLETFPGRVTHSYGYRSGREYAGERVLVVGFGNSACEIAIDLHEQGAKPSMSVRSAVNVIPRDIMGVPILQLGLWTSWLPPRLADKMNAPIFKALLGDIEKLGLKKLPYGPLEQIAKHQRVPLLDIGTLKLIREGHVKVFGDIDRIEGASVHFKDGGQQEFEAIVAAIGYDRGAAGDFIKVDARRFEDLNNSVDDQRYFGEDRLYFCGFWISPTGQIREIAQDARKIVKAIAASSR